MDAQSMELPAKLKNRSLPGHIQRKLAQIPEPPLSAAIAIPQLAATGIDQESRLSTEAKQDLAFKLWLGFIGFRAMKAAVTFMTLWALAQPKTETFLYATLTVLALLPAAGIALIWRRHRMGLYLYAASSMPAVLMVTIRKDFLAAGLSAGLVVATWIYANHRDWFAKAGEKY